MFHRSGLWDRLRFYTNFVWRLVVLQRPEPLIYGVALTDRCNLACRGCHVSNFFHVHVYTNGLFGIEPSADLAWVSMDGLPGVFERRRGDHFQQVEQAVRNGKHPRVAVIYTIDRNTEVGVEPFLRWVVETKFPVLGVMCYFHTPYYGRDELFLNAEERALIIDRLLACRRAGLPLLNSRAALLALKSGDWPRRTPIARVLDVDGEAICCRASDEVCPDCGYAACLELTEFQRLRPSAVLGMMRYW